MARGLRVDDRKLFAFENMLISKTRMYQVVKEQHDRQLLHLGPEKIRLDMNGRFESPPGLCKALKGGR